uniref:Uncharacterized protein n=1 Tax=Leptobrachium leishanense TaxID=445787 RepID=A0A8C5WKG5_9ANUR
DKLSSKGTSKLSHRLTLPPSPSTLPVDSQLDLSQSALSTSPPSDISRQDSRVCLADISAVLSPLLDEKLGRLSSTIESVLSQLTSQAQRLTEVEERVSTLEDDVNPLKAQVDAQQSVIHTLTEKLDDLENQSRRNNLRVVGLPETVRGRALQDWVSNWLPTQLGLGAPDLPLAVERVHRVGPDLNALAGRPRVVIMRLLNFVDKSNLLQAFRKANALDYNGTPLRLFQDFSASVSLKRRAFSPLCSELVAKDIRFSLLYPARLRVNFNGATHYFDSPAEASAALLPGQLHEGSTSPLPPRTPSTRMRTGKS